MIVLLLFWPGLRNRREAVDPLAGVDPPPAAAGIVAGWRERHAAVPLALGLGVVATAAALVVLSPFWQGVTAKAVIMATMFLSFVVLTGLGRPPVAVPGRVQRHRCVHRRATRGGAGHVDHRGRVRRRRARGRGGRARRAPGAAAGRPLPRARDARVRLDARQRGVRAVVGLRERESRARRAAAVARFDRLPCQRLVPVAQCDRLRGRRAVRVAATRRHDRRISHGAARQSDGGGRDRHQRAAGAGRRLHGRRRYRRLRGRVACRAGGLGRAGELLDVPIAVLDRRGARGRRRDDPQRARGRAC